MADFTKFKIGNTSYNVKDANAARDLDQGNPGELRLKNASGATIATTTLNLDGSLADVVIDSNTLANGDVVTYDSATQEWVNKPVAGGGGDAGFYPIINIERSSWSNPGGYFSALINLPKIPYTDNIGFNILDVQTSAYLGVRADAVIINGTYQNVATYLENPTSLGGTVTLDFFKWHSTQQQWFWIRVNAFENGDGFALNSVGQHGFNSIMDPTVLPSQ